MTPSVQVSEPSVEQVRVQCPNCGRGTFLTVDNRLYKHADGPMGMDTCLASGLTLKQAAALESEPSEPPLPGIGQ